MFDDQMEQEFEDRINGGRDDVDVAELSPEDECREACATCQCREDCEAAGGDPDWDDQPDESMDGDHASALASAGFGTSEDYGDFGGDEW